MRRILTLVSVVSLLLMLSTIALWVVSFDSSKSYCWPNPQRARVQVAFYIDGNVGYFRDATDYVDDKPGHHYANMFLMQLYPAGWAHGVPLGNLQAAPMAFEFLGFRAAWASNFQPAARTMVENRVIKIVVPLWMLMVLFGIVPTIWVIKFRLRRQRKILFKQGCCATCGYDLAGNTSGVCPECGTTRVVQVEAASVENAMPSTGTPGES